MKLNIGSGKKPKKGYVNIDIQKGADVVADFRTLKYEEVDEIIAEHLLEHFSRQEAIDVLKLWNSWLKKGGKLIIETPDFEEICEQFHYTKLPSWETKEEYRENVKNVRYWLARHTFGSQEADWAFHKDGWYEDKFNEILPELGFKIIGFKKSTSRKEVPLPNITVVAEKI